MRIFLLPIVLIAVVFLGGTAFIQAYAGTHPGHQHTSPKIIAMAAHGFPDEGGKPAELNETKFFLRDPWNVFFLLLGASFGSLVCFLGKLFLDKIFAKEVTEWTLWRRGSFIFVSFGTSVCLTPEALLQFYPPPIDTRILGLTFLMAVLSWVILEIIFSDLIRNYIRKKLGVDNQPPKL